MAKALAVFALLAPSFALFEHVQQKSIADAANDPSYSLRGSQRKCDPADDDLHIVSSTGCNAFQHWQAEVLLNSAMHMGQCGKMTRIVVGCDKHVDTGPMRTHQGGAADELIKANDLVKSTSPGLNVHIAPAIPEAKEFPWFNKPWSFHHWLKEKGDTIKERAIAILDPDEFFLQPLTQRTGDKSADGFEIINNYPPRLKSIVTDVVKPGMGVTQMYGFETVWLRMFDKRKICPGGPTSPCADMNEENGNLYYPAGPPYILHNSDFRKVMPTWWDLMKPVYAQDKGDIQADMYAYVYAAIHHKVKHVVLENYMVSNVDMGPIGQGEAWKFVDAIKELSCHDPLKGLEGKLRPGFVHAAGHYRACTTGDEIGYNAEECPKGGALWNFHTGHVPSTILHCDNPLIKPPPDDLFNVQVKTGTWRGKRTAFMICSLTYLVNRAALDYKRKFCNPGFNQGKCVKMITGSLRRPPEPGSPGNPWGYPLAEVDVPCNRAAGWTEAM